ncbi:MAG TPA: glycosyltransferase family 2 protein [Acidimicrobiales bacterium]|jgi:GT2 family glycosyltransferase|nr:glycosyltransferase family 2 protein [Acidimicrobiales bacterium]
MRRVRIGIVSWNTADLLDRCLTAIAASAEGLAFDVVVVDNASHDRSVQVAQQHAGITVIANKENIGYARAMNQALLYQARGDTQKPEVFIALNPDTVPTPGSLALLVTRMWAEPTVGLVVPRLVNPNGSLQHSVYRFPSPLITVIICAVPLRFQRGRLAEKWWLEGRVPHIKSCDIDWAIGAVHVIRVDALSGELPYCERWFMYVEDMDLCWRLREKGWRCRLEAEARVMHVGNAAGAQAWGATRTARWWEATYDWVRFRRGVGALRRYATVNTVGVSLLLNLSRLRRRVLGKRAGAVNASRINDLAQILPHHVTAMHEPETAFNADT